MRGRPQAQSDFLTVVNVNSVVPRFVTGFGTFIVTHKTAMTHQPAKSALDNPPARQHSKPAGGIRTLDHLNLELRSMFSDPPGKGVTCVAAVDPELAQRVNQSPTCSSTKHLLRCFPIRATGRGNHHPEHKAQGIDQNMAFAPVDLVADMIAGCTTVPVRLDALAVQDRSAGLRVASLAGAQANAQGLVEN